MCKCYNRSDKRYIYLAIFFSLRNWLLAKLARTRQICLWCSWISFEVPCQVVLLEQDLEIGFRAVAGLEAHPPFYQPRGCVMLLFSSREVFSVSLMAGNFFGM